MSWLPRLVCPVCWTGFDGMDKDLFEKHMEMERELETLRERMARAEKTGQTGMAEKTRLEIKRRKNT